MIGQTLSSTLEHCKEHHPELYPIVKAWSKVAHVSLYNSGIAPAYRVGIYPHWYEKDAVYISVTCKRITVHDSFSRDAFKKEIKKTIKHCPDGWELKL